MALWESPSQKLEVKRPAARGTTQAKSRDFEIPGGIEVAFDHQVTVLSHSSRLGYRAIDGSELGAVHVLPKVGLEMLGKLVGPNRSGR